MLYIHTSCAYMFIHTRIYIYIHAYIFICICVFFLHANAQTTAAEYAMHAMACFDNNPTRIFSVFAKNDLRLVCVHVIYMYMYMYKYIYIYI